MLDHRPVEQGNAESLQEAIYVWLVELERPLRYAFGTGFFPRHGRRTLLSLLRRAYVELRPGLYENRDLDVSSVLRQDGAFLPVQISGQLVDIEPLLVDLKNSLLDLRAVLVRFSGQEAELLAGFEREAAQWRERHRGKR
ncbi:MAG: hypothetical protein EYC70_15270 [Planctomycetota bacterium]|nr:MAG: hypothetical protein EYC70_15270 [Planctomycetota bacterium]